MSKAIPGLSTYFPVEFPPLLPEKNPIFLSRKEAGRKLGRALEQYRWQNPLVLAIPPGGVEVGLEVAGHLDADFSVLLSSRLPLPDESGAGFGAIAEDGSTYFYVRLVRTLAPELVKAIQEQKLWETQRRALVLRKGRDLPRMSDRTVILVSDGVSRGSTMKAALLFCRKRYPARIVVAVPVLWLDAKKEIEWMSDETVSLRSPESFLDAAVVRDHWPPVTDESALQSLDRWEGRRHSGRILGT